MWYDPSMIMHAVIYKAVFFGILASSFPSTYHGASGKSFELSEQQHTWSSCYDICRFRGGSLAAIRNATEQKLVDTFLQDEQPPRVFPWVGLYRSPFAADDSWSWVGPATDNTRALRRGRSPAHATSSSQQRGKHLVPVQDTRAPVWRYP